MESIIPRNSAKSHMQGLKRRAVSRVQQLCIQIDLAIHAGDGIFSLAGLASLFTCAFHNLLAVLAAYSILPAGLQGGDLSLSAQAQPGTSVV